MIRSVAVALAVLLFATVAVAPAVASTDAGGTSLATPEEFSKTVFTIQVAENGTARWTFAYSRPLENESEREQFEAFARDFEQNESSMYRDFVDRSRRLTRAGSNTTDREMNASGFSRSASVDKISNAKGVVEMSFRWSNFAVVEGDSVRVGDVFEGGLYIGQDQRLVFETLDPLVITDAKPGSYTQSGQSLQTSDSVTWIGDKQFTDNHPRVVFRPESVVTEAGAPEENPPTTAPTTQSNGDMLVLVGVLVVVIGLVGAAVWQSGALSRGSTVAKDSAADAAGSAAESASAGSDPAGIPDEKLLSDSDRVHKLLENNGGRMKQVNIVEQTDWSKSKVSMLLSEMEDEGEISKLRVGRENIISLAGHEPDAAGSPFEDDE